MLRATTKTTNAHIFLPTNHNAISTIIHFPSNPIEYRTKSLLFTTKLYLSPPLYCLLAFMFPAKLYDRSYMYIDRSDRSSYFLFNCLSSCYNLIPRPAIRFHLTIFISHPLYKQPLSGNYIYLRWLHRLYFILLFLF